MKPESEYVLRSAAILAHSALDDASAVNSALQYGGTPDQMAAVKKTAQAADDAIDHVQNLLYILVGRSAQRCPECGKKHANALSLEWDRRRNEELQAQRQGLAAERSSRVLHAEVRAAEKAGLNYGKYMLQKMQANKKPAGAPTPTSCKG